jgi:hypothetical protein
MANPKFVRLADHMVHGMCVDLDTEWSIAGYDVKEFPEDRDQARFVRSKITAGVLEPAGQAEYDEVHADDGEAPSESDVAAAQFVEAVKAAAGTPVLQEHKVREGIAEKQASLAASRRASAEEDAPPKKTSTRRKRAAAVEEEEVAE